MSVCVCMCVCVSYRATLSLIRSRLQAKPMLSLWLKPASVSYKLCPIHSSSFNYAAKIVHTRHTLPVLLSISHQEPAPGQAYALTLARTCSIYILVNYAAKLVHTRRTLSCTTLNQLSSGAGFRSSLQPQWFLWLKGFTVSSTKVAPFSNLM